MFRACAKVGDVQTAYDALQDMRLRGFKLNVHGYNGLIKTYAGAAAQWKVKEEHIDMYVDDAMKLFNQMVEGGIKPNVFVLNSLTLLHANALRPDDLDSTELPLYDKHRIKHDVYTYQHLGKMYLNLREFDTIKKLYKAMKTEKITPNKALANSFLEASMRTNDSDNILEGLQDFVDMKHEPHFRLKGTLANMKSLPDRIYIMMREHFGADHPAL